MYCIVLLRITIMVVVKHEVGMKYVAEKIKA